MISVIIPYKDAAKTLERCLESCHKQYGDLEFICVDDGSKDSGPAIVEKYAKADKRFVSLENTNKLGVSGARNTGLKYATGEWITFLDADDELTENAAATFTRTIEALGGDYNIFQFNHYRHYESIGKTALKYTNPPKEFVLPELPILWCSVWNKLYNAELLKGIKFDQSMQFGEDEMFNLNVLAKDHKIFCVNNTTTTRHFDGDNRLTKTKTEKDVWKLAENLTKFAKKSEDPDMRRALCKRLSDHWAGLFMKSFGGDVNAQ